MMNKTGFVLLLLASLGTDALLASAETPSLVRALGNQKVVRGCGCSFTDDGSSTEQATLFFAELNGPAWVNIRGSDLKLASIVPAPACCLQKVGDKVTMRYRGTGAEVVVAGEVTWTCPVDSSDESCEVFRLRGKLTAKTSGAQQTLNVTGECGC